MTVTPYLSIRNAAAAIDFYRDVFGAVEDHRLLGDDGRIGHAEITIGTSRLMLADEYPEVDSLGPESRGGPTCMFDVSVPDVDDVYARSLSFGATSLSEPADQFHGSRSATIRDPFGHRWTLSTLIETLGTEEYAARAAQDEGHGSFALQNADPETGATSETGADVSTSSRQVKPLSQGDLYYFALPVQDIARAQRFFGAVLGWQFAEPDNGHVDNISAPPGGVNAGTADTGARLWFVVDDIQTAVTRVRELGGSADDPVEYPSGWSADCTDDQGTAFSLTVPSAEYAI